MYIHVYQTTRWTRLKFNNVILGKLDKTMNQRIVIANVGKIIIQTYIVFAL